MALRVELVCLTGQEVHDALEAGFVADRRLNRNRPRGELFETIDCLPEVGVLLVHFVDDDERGEILRAQLLPGELGANHHARARTHHQQGALGRAERAMDLTHEVLETRRVHQVDLVVVPGQVRDGGADRDLSLGLLGLEVERRVAGVRTSESVDRATGKEHRLSQAGLAVVAMPE